MTNKKKADQKAHLNTSDSQYSINRRLAQVLEVLDDGHSVMILCPYCEQPHLHLNPTPADPLRLRKAVCNQMKTYIIGGVSHDD